MYVRTGISWVRIGVGFGIGPLGTVTLLTRAWDEFVGGYLIFYLQLIVHYMVVPDVCIGLLYGTGCAPLTRWVLLAASRDVSDLSHSSLYSLSSVLKPWWTRSSR